ncbi:hypothetical protein I3842_01G138000 [Carya illinoinensis]|uniref:DELLA RGL1-like protein n=1 Tax=Carya illinoinensis TaxID=32201 RepID=A0A922G076_CARIL|nr:hypothetical protein I3842_01G138000 [Carya illinoinensis]
MANKVFSFGEEFGFDAVEDKFTWSEKVWESMDKVGPGNCFHFNGPAEEWGSDSGIYQEDLSEEDFNFSQHQQQEASFSENGLLDDLQFHAISPQLHTCLEEIAKLGEFPTLIPEVQTVKWGQSNRAKLELSTEEIVRLAGAGFIQSTSQAADGPSMPIHPFDLDFCGLSDDERRDMELAESLFASAEKAGSQQFERARKFLNQCDHLSSNTGNPVQRVVYYFSEALRQKIDRETGRNTSKDSGKSPSIDVDKELMNPSPPTLANHEELPFCQVTQFAGIQAIIKNTVEARKIHIIDLGIRNGVQWTILMQALATRCECPLELLKITAVGTTSKHLLMETGKRLASFAQSLNLPFSFNVVMVSDMLDLREDLFELDADETLESIMEVVRSINPCIMFVTEIEANHNSPAFVSRFVEALFYFKSKFFGKGIRNIVAAEGEERKIRNVKIDVWRAFFARYGMLETEFSTSSLYQASLLVKKFRCEKSFTLDMNGKCLITLWKVTPICSLSAWKFLSQ